MSKRSEFLKSLSSLDIQKLHEKEQELRREIFSLRLNSVTSHVKNTAQFSHLRQDLARVLTAISAKENAA